MTDALLQELSSSDLQWAIAKGKQQEISEGETWSEVYTANNLYILLNGTLSLTLAQQSDNPLTDIFDTLEAKDKSNQSKSNQSKSNQSKSNQSNLEITRLSRGEIIGENALTGLKNKGTAIKTLGKCQLLSIPLEELKIKSEQDVEFAARFYRAIAVLYLNRLEGLLERLGRRNFAQSQPVRDVLYLFGKLHDSDLDWAMTNGTLQKVSAQSNLIRQGERVDALYLLLNGQMSVFFETEGHNPLDSIFATLEDKKEDAEPLGKEIAKLQKGEIIGEAPFIDGRLPYATVKAKENSLVLSLARPLLIAKLQQDVGFAARFYQAISTLLACKLQGVIGKLSPGRRTYARNQSLGSRVQSENELDEDLLEQMSIAATKFDWMLKRLRVN